jgi:hypothetical protein
MTTEFIYGGMCAGFGMLNYPSTEIGPHPISLASRGRQRLATDTLGTFTLTLKNAVRGSCYVIERPSDDSLATPTGSAEGVIPAGAGTVTDHAITLDYYAPGSSNNNLRITLRNASGTPAYKNFETQTTAQAGTVTAFCAQELDE